MKHIILFENFNNILTKQYLEENYPITKDDYFEKEFNRQRFFINIDDKNYFFSKDEGFNSTKMALLNVLSSKGMIKDERIDVPIIKGYLRSVLL